MKNEFLKKVKRGIAALLAGVMVFGLAGCGKDSNEIQARKEFYYVPEYKDLNLTVNYINNVFCKDDTLLLLGAWWDETTGESGYKLYRYNLLTDESEELMLSLAENASMQQAAMDSEGNLLMIVNRYEESGTEDEAQADMEGMAAEAVTYESYVELWKVSSKDGSIISQVDIKPVFDDPDNSYIQSIAVDDRGNIYFSVGESAIYILDQNGNKLGSIATDGSWVDSIFAAGKGNVYMQAWGEQGRELKQIDPDTMTIGEAIKSESMDGLGYNQRYYPGMEKGILIDDGSGVFSFDIESDTIEELFQWLDSDINSDDVNSMGTVSDGSFYVVLRDYTGEKTEYSLAVLTKTPASEIPEKEEIVYGTTWLSQSIRKSIIDFNKSSDKYHITVKDYMSDGDYDTGLTQFNNDITSGNGPDIINLSDIDYNQYASKGVLEDLYPYMERDGINRSDYLENVLGAYELDEKLYGIVPQFYICTTIGKTAKVGDAQGWTLSEMLDFAESSDAENIFQYGTRDSIFQYCIYNNIDEFINWETGECFFNGEDFIRMLEFAAKFPEEADYNYDEGIHAKLGADKVLLLQASLSSVQEFQMYSGLFGEEITFVGYPNSERRGNLIQPTNGSVALSAKSKHKDGAWEFIKLLISEEYQDSLVSSYGSGWGFPIRKSSLEKQFENDMKVEYYEDENGNQVESIKTGWGYDDFNIDIYAARQEEVDAVKEIIASAEKCTSSINTELTNIMTEETAAFFKGQKSAKETADIIQNRIQIYVNENS